tara:strand:- start:267 stop:719 length:453 start_codon:yes stop_codon:yes gene_type:complete
MKLDTNYFLISGAEDVFAYASGGVYILDIDAGATDGIRFTSDTPVCLPLFSEALGASSGVAAGQSVDASTSLPGGGTQTFFYGRWKIVFAKNAACINKYLGVDILGVGYRESAERIVYSDECYQPPAPPSPPPPLPPPMHPPETPPPPSE